MLRISGSLRIADLHGETLVRANGERLTVTPASLAQSVGLIRQFGWRRLQGAAGLLRRVGLTLAVESRVGPKLVMGKGAAPGPILRGLGLAHVALGWGRPGSETRAA